MPTPGKSKEDMAAAIASRPPGLKCTFNLGVADFYPAATGKEGAAAHLLARWGGDPGAAAHLCDDDNDLPLAAMVGRAFLPSITEVGVGGGGSWGGAVALLGVMITTCHWVPWWGPPRARAPPTAPGIGVGGGCGRPGALCCLPKEVDRRDGGDAGGGGGAL
jgi:hypothetical protein